jgi:proline dehydrogenase
MSLMRNVLLWASENQWLRNTAPKIFFVKKAVKRFMPGEHLEDAVEAAQELQKKGLATVFTRLGENITELSEAEQVTDHYIEVLKKITQSKIDTEISLKLTQIGLDLSFDKTYDYFRTIVRKAIEYNNFVWIDIESSAYTDVTIDFYEKARSEFENVGLCLQAYLYRTADDLTRLIKLTPAIRLVKGAYKEPAAIAFPKKKDVDQNFYKLSLQMLEAQRNGTRSVFATHDVKLISQIQQAARGMGIADNELEFKLLYGIRMDEQMRLVENGHKVRSLISYGEFWYPWYVRRLAERPANFFFVLKNIISR